MNNNSIDNSKVKTDRYAPVGESDIGEEEMKRMINSPLSRKSKDENDSKPPDSGSGLKNAPSFSAGNFKTTANGPTFAEVEKRENMSSMLTVPQDSQLSSGQGKRNIEFQIPSANVTGFLDQKAQNKKNEENELIVDGPLVKDFAKTKPVLKQEEERAKKLENMKHFVQFKKVVDYESETIELYDMMSLEFDYEDVRKNSPSFTLKQYKDSLYRGEVNQQKKREGRGVIVYEIGRIYEGTWLNDKRHGKGYELFSNGNTYHGEYQNGKPNGKGVYTWTNGEAFDGEWQNGKKEGNGIWKGINGESYIGEWKANKAHGFGVHTWNDGDKYEGEWFMSLRHGKGTDFFSNGDIYIGHYQEGKPQGQGQYKWANGNTYKGEFQDGMKHGRGKWKKYPSNPADKKKVNQYDGFYENDKKHGYGEFTWESGNKYYGNYHYDVRQGYGTMQWTDGGWFKGHWVNGVQHGLGIICFPDGKKKAGFFENNVYVMPLKDEEALKILEQEIPQDIVDEIKQYIQERQQRPPDILEESENDNSGIRESEAEMMGQNIQQMQLNEDQSDKDTMKALKNMFEVGTQQNPNNQENFVNLEGLKRVYKPRAQREAELQAQIESQQKQEQTQALEYVQEQPEMVNAEIQADTLFNKPHPIQFYKNQQVQADEMIPRMVQGVQTSDQRYFKSNQVQTSNHINQSRNKQKGKFASQKKDTIPMVPSNETFPNMGSLNTSNHREGSQNDQQARQQYTNIFSQQESKGGVTSKTGAFREGNIDENHSQQQIVQFGENSTIEQLRQELGIMKDQMKFLSNQQERMMIEYQMKRRNAGPKSFQSNNYVLGSKKTDNQIDEENNEDDEDQLKLPLTNGNFQFGSKQSDKIAPLSTFNNFRSDEQLIQPNNSSISGKNNLNQIGQMVSPQSNFTINTLLKQNSNKTKKSIMIQTDMNMQSIQQSGYNNYQITSSQNSSHVSMRNTNHVKFSSLNPHLDQIQSDSIQHDGGQRTDRLTESERLQNMRVHHPMQSSRPSYLNRIESNQISSKRNSKISPNNKKFKQDKTFFKTKEKFQQLSPKQRSEEQSNRLTNKNVQTSDQYPIETKMMFNNPSVTDTNKEIQTSNHNYSQRGYQALNSRNTSQEYPSRVNSKTKDLIDSKEYIEANNIQYEQQIGDHLQDRPINQFVSPPNIEILHEQMKLNNTSGSIKNRSRPSPSDENQNSVFNSNVNSGQFDVKNAGTSMGNEKETTRHSNIMGATRTPKDEINHYLANESMTFDESNPFPENAQQKIKAFDSQIRLTDERFNDPHIQKPSLPAIKMDKKMKTSNLDSGVNFNKKDTFSGTKELMESQRNIDDDATTFHNPIFKSQNEEKSVKMVKKSQGEVSASIASQVSFSKRQFEIEVMKKDKFRHNLRISHQNTEADENNEMLSFFEFGLKPFNNENDQQNKNNKINFQYAPNLDLLDNFGQRDIKQLLNSPSFLPTSGPESTNIDSLNMQSQSFNQFKSKLNSGSKKSVHYPDDQAENFFELPLIGEKHIYQNKISKKKKGKKGKKLRNHSIFGQLNISVKRKSSPKVLKLDRIRIPSSKF